MKRIFLYLGTHLAIILVLGTTLRLLGFERTAALQQAVNPVLCRWRRPMGRDLACAR
jgi:hypothetical protein